MQIKNGNHEKKKKKKKFTQVTDRFLKIMEKTAMYKAITSDYLKPQVSLWFRAVGG